MNKMRVIASAFAGLMLVSGAMAQDGMSEGLHIDGTQILDAKNNELVMRRLHTKLFGQRVSVPVADVTL